MMCTALKVHASASTHVLQFLARGGGVGVGTYQCKRGLTHRVYGLGVSGFQGLLSVPEPTTLKP